MKMKKVHEWLNDAAEFLDTIDSDELPTCQKEKNNISIRLNDADVCKINSACKGDSAAHALKLWYCLNRMAFHKGNDFATSYVVLSRETFYHNKTLSKHLGTLEQLRFISIERGKSSRVMNRYKLLRGCYVNHTRETSAPDTLGEW